MTFTANGTTTYTHVEVDKVISIKCLSSVAPTRSSNDTATWPETRRLRIRVRPRPPATPPTQTYTVVSGDSLSKIAKRVYGSAKAWRKIYEANKDVVNNPDLIYPGQELKIPGA